MGWSDVLHFRRAKYEDYRVRRNRTERQNEAWEDLYDELTSAYMEFDYHGRRKDSLERSMQIEITVIALTSEQNIVIKIIDTNFVLRLESRGTSRLWRRGCSYTR